MPTLSGVCELGYPLKAGQIRRDKKELRSFLSRFAVVAANCEAVSG
jgi:hypothetical protein